jgi:hypothetical protein
MRATLFWLALTLLLSCKQPEDKAEGLSLLHYRLNNFSIPFDYDSVRSVKNINHLTEYFITNPGQDSILKTDTVSFYYGHLFSPKSSYLLAIQNFGKMYCYVHFYKYNGSGFDKITLVEDDMMRPILDDSIVDINGDKYKDIVFHWYPMSGCCRADVYDVYLYKSNADKITGAYSFINPTFYPKEKVIRGVMYGQPGNTELYKYKWNGLAVDTIEYIVHEKPNAKTYYKRHGVYDTTQQVKLKNIPAEYRNIESLDWFIGDGY